MRRLLCFILVLLVVTPVAAQKPDDVEKEVANLVNAYRVKKGAGKLTIDDKLTAIAQEHARGMAKANKYGDTDKNGHVWMGKNAADRTKDAKYAFALLGENPGVNASAKPAQTAVKYWIAAKGYEKTMSNKEYTHTGIGAAKSKQGRWFFVMLLSIPLATAGKVEVTLENRTKKTITVQAQATKFEMKADDVKIVTFAKREKAKLSITWPAEKKGDKEKVEEVEVIHGGTYAMSPKKEGGFVFEKLVVKDDKGKIILENKTGQTITIRAGNTKFQIPTETTGTLEVTQSTKPVKISVVWPVEKKGDKEKIEEVEVMAGTAYAMTRKKEGGFAFEKVKAKK